MQSTEEYLDQLLASVSDEPGNGQNVQQNTVKKHRKSIEELDESELTEEVLQKQLALLLGLETEPEEDEFEDDFISQYAEQVAEPVSPVASEIMDIPEEVIEPEIMDIPEVVAEPVPEPVAEAAAPALEISSTGVLSADEIAALFASMEAPEEPAKEEAAEAMPEPVAEAAPTPEISSTGVLSADEIEALFASMGMEEEELSLGDAIVEEMMDETIGETEDVVEVIEETEDIPATPQVSDSGILSPDEIAALFASMESGDSGETEDVVEVVEEEDTGALSREELEELGLGDMADVLDMDIYGQMADDLEEITHPHDVNLQEVELTEDSTKVEPEEEKQIIEIPDFENGEELLLDIENVDAMLEATAKLAEEESFDSMENQVEDDILSMLAQFEEESVMESMAAQEESAKAAEEAVNMALEDETPGVPEELLAEENDGRKKKKPKKEKVKKEKVKKEKVKKEKPVKEKKEKVSLKDKISAFMFEEESLDDGEADGVVAEGAEGDDLLEAKPAKAKKEKASKKDKKSKKAKDGKGGKPQDENAAIEAELAEEDKKKAKKKEKPPKEKKPKKVVFAEEAPAEEETARRKGKGTIGTKGIVATLLVCASLLGLILVGTYFLPKQLSLAAARVAFYAQDYEEAAMRLKGQDLNDSDRILFEKANLLYGLEERYHQYEIYMQRGMDKEALNALFQGVATCNEEEILAGQLGIETEWKLAKDAFTNALQEQFGVDAQLAEEIAALRNPNYTVAVENILAGRAYNDMSSYGGEAPVNTEETTEEEAESGEETSEENLEDLLPEEEAILQQMQQENEPNQQGEEPAASENDDVLYSGSVEGGAVNFVE